MEREKLIATVTAAQSGDGDALNELFNAFYNDVYYFALKTVKDDDLACDITQETFVEIISTIGDLHEPAAFVKWMKQITYHQCTRYFKKKKDVLVDEDEEGNTIFDTLKEDNVEFIPDEALDQQDFRDTILAMLDELSEEQRSATMLFYYDELSVKQIAEIQNVSEGTVKSRLNYARKSIKSSVETYEKKNGIKLHCAGVLPLLLWLLSQTGKETMPAAAANAVASGVTTATGVTVSVAAVSTGGAAVAAATATTVATATSAGIAAKIAALPVIAKVIAGVVAGSLVLGGVGLAVLPEKDPVATDPIITTEPADTQETTADQTEQTNQTESTQTTEAVPRIPEGCTYILADGTRIEAGEPMPKISSPGDSYITLDYTYLLEQNGWRVQVNDKTKESYGPLLAQINEKPLTSMDSTFSDCTNMTVAPEIPVGVTSLHAAFGNCTSLVTAPAIPNTVTHMWNTFSSCTALVQAPVIPASVTSINWAFMGCTSLTGIIEINGIPEPHGDCDYENQRGCGLCGSAGFTCENCGWCSHVLGCFEDTTQPITLIGSSPCLSELAATGNNGNVKLEADTVYSQADAANSIQLGESRLHNWPDFGENQTAMTDFTWTYTISTSQVPICRVRSVEAIRANLGGSPCEIYQTASSEKAWAIVNKYGAASAIETDLLTVIQIKSPPVLMDKTTQYLDMVFEIFLRFTLENGQVMDLRYTDDVVWFGSGGILMDCTTEDFQ